MHPVIFSSDSVEWGTPQALFDAQNLIHNFTLDVAASVKNHKCPRYFTQKMDGLAQSWKGERCWMNPPYGRAIRHWMEKACNESKNGALVVALVPARTDTIWWHSFAMKGQIEFLKGRIKFCSEKAVGTAPFPSALITFHPSTE